MLKKIVIVILLTFCGFIYADAQATTYRCTETWNGFTVSRDCTSPQQSSCETCFLTGSGCTVTCEEKTLAGPE